MIQPDYSRDISRQQAVTAASLRAWIDSPDDYKLECLLRYREGHPSFMIPGELLWAYQSASAQARSKSRRQRKPSLTRLAAKAKKLGVALTIEPNGAVTVRADNTTNSVINEWDAELIHGKH